MLENFKLVKIILSSLGILSKLNKKGLLLQKIRWFGAEICPSFKLEEYAYDHRPNTPILPTLQHKSLKIKQILLKKFRVKFLSTKFCQRKTKQS